MSTEKLVAETAQELKPVAATLPELKAAFPGATSEFLLAQLEASATIEQATRAYIAHQDAELAAAKQREEEARKEAAESKAAAEEAKQKSLEGMPGNQDDGSSAGETTVYENAAEKWRDLIRQRTEKGMSRQEVAVKVDRENPGLREQYLQEWRPRPNPLTAPSSA